ncbi:hypothetical protein Adu01nite_64750 [Paractinoplanes durhamensis]|uniref:Uncharacterized protein n=2 Tax=Paractinoplanes durhamensis TaxID=113563 RepID=A0ABQ3Z5N1_9ACTN|nr:hypothetical protein Adu01nite_64750 [Actinoplanes durhamensis]
MAAAVLLTITGLGPAVAQAAAVPDFDFNDAAVGTLPAGWSVSDSGATVGVVPVPDAVNRSLQVTGAGTATTTLTALTGTVRAEARVRGSGVAGRLDVLTIAGNAGPVASVVIRNGDLAGTAAADNRWYAIRAELNTADRQWDLYVDGARLITDAPFESASTELTALSTGVPDGYAGSVNVDDVVVRAIPAPSVSYLVEDGFNDAPVGAPPAGYQATAGVAVVATPSAADRSLRLAKSTTADGVSALRSFPAQSAVFFVHANLRTDETTGTKVALYLQNDAASPVISLQFVQNHLVYWDGTTGYQLATITAGEWYTVHLAINVTTHRFEIYIDGKRFSPSATAGSTSVPQWVFRDQTATSISRLLFGVGAGQTGTVMVDNLLVYQNAPADLGTIKDVTAYGAVPDGTTLNTAAIQRAIDETPAGGTVKLDGGAFRTGSLRLKSDMTLWISRGSTLLGSQADADYPLIRNGSPETGIGDWKALLYSIGASNIRIDGGGTIDGNGTAAQWVNCEGSACGLVRPTLLAPMSGRDISIRNVYLRNSAAWAVMPVQVDGLLIADVNLDSDLKYNRDGIDVVDSSNVLIERTTVWADDDAICLKSNTVAGVNHVTVRQSTVARSTRANGLKLGTASFGAFRDVAMEDVLVKHTDKGAITVNVTDGGVAAQLAFRRITVDGSRLAYFVLLGRRTADRTNPPLPAWASGVRLEDITATHLVEPSIVTGQIIDGTTYRVYDVLVSNVRTAVPGGVTKIPAEPIEYRGEYPESSLWTATGYGILPVYGHFFRHIDGLTVRGAETVPTSADARPAIGLRDVLTAG